MKKILILSFILFLGIFTFAQDIDYSQPSFGTFPPTGWTTVVDGASSKNWEQINYAILNGDDQNIQNEWIVSPSISTVAATMYRVSFDYWSDGLDANSELYVLVSDDDGATYDFALDQAFLTSSVTGWNHVVNLPIDAFITTLGTDIIKVAIIATSDETNVPSATSWILDNIVIENDGATGGVTWTSTATTVQSFETSMTNNGWSVINGVATAEHWTLHSIAGVVADDTDNQDTWLISNLIDLPEIAHTQVLCDLSWYSYTNDNTFVGTQLFVTTDGGATWGAAEYDMTFSNTNVDDFYSASVDLTAYQGDSIRIGIRHQSLPPGNQADFFLESFHVYQDFDETLAAGDNEYVDIVLTSLAADESILYPLATKYDSTIAEGFWQVAPYGWTWDTTFVGSINRVSNLVDGSHDYHVFIDTVGSEGTAMDETLTSEAIAFSVPNVGASFVLSFDWATEPELMAGVDTDPNISGSTYDFGDIVAQITTNNGVSWTTIWAEDDEAILEATTNGWVDYATYLGSVNTWYTANVDISQYLTGTGSFKIRFNYTGVANLSGYFALDNFYVLQTTNPEFEFDGTLPFSATTTYQIDYTNIPISQFDNPVNFGALIHNYGLPTFTNGQLDVFVNGDSYGYKTITPAVWTGLTLPATAKVVVDNFANQFATGFTAEIGSYSIDYNLQVNGSAILPSVTKDFEVTDDTYAKVDLTTPPGASLLIDDLTSGAVGSVFEFVNTDVVSSVGVMLNSAVETEAYLTIIKLATPNSTTGTKVYTSPRVVIEDIGDNWYTFEVNTMLDASSFYAFMINLTDASPVSAYYDNTVEGQIIRGNSAALYYDAMDANIFMSLEIVPNENPVILTEFPNDKLVVAAGDSVVIEILATDANIGDTETLSWPTIVSNPTWLASWMTFIDKGDTLIITGKPTNDDLGTCNLDVTVADTKNGSGNYNFNVEVVSDLAYFQPDYQADFRQFTQDDDLLLTGNSEPWSRSQFQATIDGASDKQEEWLISAPILIPAAAKATGKSYDLEFDWLLGSSSVDSKYFIGGIPGALGTEDVNGGANYADVSLLVSIDNGSTWGAPIWKEDEPALLAPVTEGIYQGEKWGYEGDQTYTSIINLDAYQGQVLMFAFVYESKNALTGGENYFEITNFEIYSNDEVDVDIYLHTDLTSVPTQHLDWTAGLEYTVQLINYGQSIPEGSLYSLSFPIQGYYEEFAISDATFALSDTVYTSFTFVPDSGLVNQAYTLTATLEVNNNVGSAADTKTITVADNVLNKDKSADVSEYTLAQYDGLGTVYQLLTDDYLEEIDVNFASAGADFSVTIIQLEKADTTAGKLIATINDDGGAQLTTNGGSLTIVIEDDNDFEKPLMLKAGYYAVMFNQLVDGDQIDIWRSDRDQDMLGFVRGNMNMLYNEVDDKGFLDMALNFKANEAPEFTTLSIENEEIYQGEEFERPILVNNLNTYGDIFIEGVDIPQWLVFIDNGDGTASLEGSAVDAVPGVYTVSLRAHNRFMITDEEFEITVLANPLPVFTTTPPSVAFVNAQFSYTAMATDELMETVEIAAELLPSWLTASVVNDTVTLTGTPLTSNIGNNVVKLSATDIYGNVSHQTFDLFVYANEVPVFVTSPVTASSVGLAYSYYIVASDANGNSGLVISADPTTLASDWLTFTDLGSGKATLVGTPDTVGVDTVTLTVTDLAGTSAVQSFVIVRNSNGAPTFISTPITTATEDVIYSYPISATDGDGDYLYFNTLTIPNWLTFTVTGNGKAVLQGIPLQSSEGDTIVSILVGDGNNTTIQSFIIVLTMVDDAPAIVSDAIENAIVGEEYSYSVEAYDEEGAELVFNAQLPSWLSITESFGGIATISGTPTVNDLGKAAVVVNVTDGNSLVEQAFEVSVSNVLGVIGDNSLVVELYPNPTTGLFTLKNAEGADVTVISSTGQIVKQIIKASKEESINISELRAGTYFVKIVTNDQVVTKSFNLIK